MSKFYQKPIQRFTENNGLVESPQGEFVRHEEYVELEDKLEIAISALRKMNLALKPPMGREDEIFKAGEIQFNDNVRHFAQKAFAEIGVEDNAPGKYDQPLK